jgi:uncharacterized membrane-anchored protein
MNIEGYAKKGIITKELIKNLEPIDIPVIYHEDIDEVAAYSLLNKKVKAVINCKKSLTGKYPAKGANILIKKGVIILDNLGEDFFNSIKSKDYINIIGKGLYINNNIYSDNITVLNEWNINQMIQKSNTRFNTELKNFINNTLEYAEKEKDIFVDPVIFPPISLEIANKQVLIVARGNDYINDLKTIKKYIEVKKPVLIGVDGGGDGLLSIGYTPDIIIGDMDSVSDECLYKTKEIIVHAYINGYAPGMGRIKKLGLKAKIFPFPGTSEDVAMLLAYENNAELIVAIGTHSNAIDFFEKGRNGMASTMLVRLKIGSKLIDAKGVNKLFLQ